MQPYIVSKKDRFSNIRLIDASEKYHQSIFVRDAEDMAYKSGLNLVCFSLPNKDSLPLCKIIDYGKWKYSNEKVLKKEKLQNKHCVKEIRFSPVISENDISHKVKQISEFLNEGDEVILTMRFKGVQKRNFKIGEDKMNDIITLCKEYGEEDSRKRTDNQIAVRFKKHKTKKI